MTRLRRQWARSKRIITGIGVVLVLVLCTVLVVLVVNVNASNKPPTLPLSHLATKVRGTCGNAGQPTCPVDPGWFSIAAESSSAVMASITSGSREFEMLKGQFGYVSMDTPILVHHYGPHTGIDYFDDGHWVVSVRNNAGQRCGIFDFVYDRTLHRMRFSAFAQLMPGDARGPYAFPYISLQKAIGQLLLQRHITVMLGRQPELIFFPIDPEWRDPHSPVHNWTGSGQSPMEPMWHLVGSDGHDYFMGADLHIHIASDLPIAHV